MGFDPSTLMTAAVVILLVFGLVTAIAWADERQAPALLWWTCAFMIGAGGFILLLMAPDHAGSLSRELANISFLLGYGCSYTAARRLSGRPVIVSALLGGSFLWCIAAWLLHLAPGWRMVLSSPLLALYSLATAYELWRGSQVAQKARRACALLCLAHGCFFVGRMVLGPALGLGDSGVETALSLWGALMTLEAIGYAAALAVLVSMMSRYESNLLHRRLAYQDELTGIGNRRAFEQDGGALVRGERDHALPPIMLLLDLDGFKRVNDHFGHDIGDRVLIDFVDVVRRNLPEPELFWRLGGDEFVILLRGQTRFAAYGVAETLCRMVEAEPCLRLSEEARVTVTIGMAVAQSGSELDDLYRQADAELYLGKSIGRNQVSAPGFPVLGTA